MEKSYFSERSEAQIRKELRLKEASEGLIETIVQLEPSSEGLVIRADLIPVSYDSPRKFMKHGPEVKLPRFRSIEQSLKYGKTPVQLRWQAFDKDLLGKYNGYSFRPFTGADGRIRKVSLVECLEGTQLYCYSHQRNVPIKITPYGDAKRVWKEGAEIIIDVPSRTDKKPRIQYKFSSVPIIDSPRKLPLAFSILTDHSCEKKRFDIKYNYQEEKQDSRVFSFCAHEIAGYLEVINYYLNNEKNMIPLQMNPFAIPTQFTVDFFKKLGNNCVIETQAENTLTEEKRITRKLNDAEREILLWGLISKKGHDKTFFATEKVKDYNWAR